MDKASYRMKQQQAKLQDLLEIGLRLQKQYARELRECQNELKAAAGHLYGAQDNLKFVREALIAIRQALD